MQYGIIKEQLIIIKILNLIVNFEFQSKGIITLQNLNAYYNVMHCKNLFEIEKEPYSLENEKVLIFFKGLIVC